MTADPRFAGRVVRLALTSLVALGLIFLLWAVMKQRSALIGAGLGAGWALMPSLLLLSLRWPEVRYGLVVPSASVGLGLVGLCLFDLPPSAAGSAGWILITCGVLFGGLLGAWFWFRWLPVPAALDDPYSRDRWVLIGIHVGLIVAGIVLVGASTLA